MTLVSGGHSMIVSMEGPGRYRLLGQTLDDAAGEAFDKVARFLGLGYPGGPAIEKAAAAGDPTAFRFPRAMLADGLDLSFSGLKTAVMRAVEPHPEASNEDVAASFQQAVVDVLVAKAVRAVEAVGAGGLCLAGGVAANAPLRAALQAAGDALGHPRLPAHAGHVHRQRRHDRRRRLLAARESGPEPSRHPGRSQSPSPAPGLKSPPAVAAASRARYR